MFEQVFEFCVLQERNRWLKAVVNETSRPDPMQRWSLLLSWDYNCKFFPTKEAAEQAALKFVELHQK